MTMRCSHVESCAFDPNLPMERNADTNASCTASRASSSERMKRRATRSIIGMCVRTSVSYAPASPSRSSATSDASCRCCRASIADDYRAVSGISAPLMFAPESERRNFSVAATRSSGTSFSRGISPRIAGVSRAEGMSAFAVIAVPFSSFASNSISTLSALFATVYATLPGAFVRAASELMTRMRPGGVAIHHRQRLADRDERGREIQVEHLRPRFVGRLGDAPRREAAREVHESIRRADRSHGVADGRGIGEIGVHAAHVRRSLGTIERDDFILVAKVTDDFRAEAAGGAGDDERAHDAHCRRRASCIVIRYDRRYSRHERQFPTWRSNVARVAASRPSSR